MRNSDAKKIFKLLEKVFLVLQFIGNQVLIVFAFFPCSEFSLFKLIQFLGQVMEWLYVSSLKRT